MMIFARSFSARSLARSLACTLNLFISGACLIARARNHLEDFLQCSRYKSCLLPICLLDKRLRALYSWKWRLLINAQSFTELIASCLIWDGHELKPLPHPTQRGSQSPNDLLEAFWIFLSISTYPASLTTRILGLIQQLRSLFRPIGWKLRASAKLLLSRFPLI